MTGLYKSLTPSTRYYSGSLYGQPDGGAHVRAAECSGRGQPQISLLMGTMFLSNQSQAKSVNSGCDNFSFSRNSHPRGCFLNILKWDYKWFVATTVAFKNKPLHRRVKNVPKLPPHSDFIIYCKQLCVCNQRWPLWSIVLSERM